MTNTAVRDLVEMTRPELIAEVKRLKQKLATLSAPATTAWGTGVAYATVDIFEWGVPFGDTDKVRFYSKREAQDFISAARRYFRPALSEPPV